MTSSLKAAIISGAAKVLGLPGGHPLLANPSGDQGSIDSALGRLRERLIALDPAVTDAVATRSFDGSPQRQNLNLRIYLEPPTDREFAAILSSALAEAWTFTEFLPAAVSIQVWRGARQVPPYDNSARVDPAPVASLVGVPGLRVARKVLTVSSKDLESRFGPRATGRS